MEPREDWGTPEYQPAFNFTLPHRRVDWEKVSKWCSPSKLASTKDKDVVAARLENSLGDVLYGDVQPAAPGKDEDLGVNEDTIHALRVAQLTAQYLTHTQDTLARRCKAVQKNIEVGVERLQQAHQKFQQRKARKHAMRRELTRLEDLISKYDVTLKVLRPDLAKVLEHTPDGGVTLRVPETTADDEEPDILAIEPPGQPSELSKEWQAFTHYQAQMKDWQSKAKRAKSTADRLVLVEQQLAALEAEKLVSGQEADSSSRQLNNVATSPFLLDPDRPGGGFRTLEGKIDLIASNLPEDDREGPQAVSLRPASPNLDAKNTEVLDMSHRVPDNTLMAMEYAATHRNCRTSDSEGLEEQLLDRQHDLRQASGDGKGISQTRSPIAATTPQSHPVLSECGDSSNVGHDSAQGSSGINANENKIDFHNLTGQEEIQNPGYENFEEEENNCDERIDVGAEPGHVRPSEHDLSQGSDPIKFEPEPSSPESARHSPVTEQEVRATVTNEKEDGSPSSSTSSPSLHHEESPQGQRSIIKQGDNSVEIDASDSLLDDQALKEDENSNRSRITDGHQSSPGGLQSDFNAEKHNSNQNVEKLKHLEMDNQILDTQVEKKERNSTEEKQQDELAESDGAQQQRSSIVSGVADPHANGQVLQSNIQDDIGHEQHENDHNGDRACSIDEVEGHSEPKDEHTSQLSNEGELHEVRSDGSSKSYGSPSLQHGLDESKSSGADENGYPSETGEQYNDTFESTQMELHSESLLDIDQPLSHGVTSEFETGESDPETPGGDLEGLSPTVFEIEENDRSAFPLDRYSPSTAGSTSSRQSLKNHGPGFETSADSQARMRDSDSSVGSQLSHQEHHGNEAIADTSLESRGAAARKRDMESSWTMQDLDSFDDSLLESFVHAPKSTARERAHYDLNQSAFLEDEEENEGDDEREEDAARESKVDQGAISRDGHEEQRSRDLSSEKFDSESERESTLEGDDFERQKEGEMSDNDFDSHEASETSIDHSNEEETDPGVASVLSANPSPASSKILQELTDKANENEELEGSSEATFKPPYLPGKSSNWDIDAMKAMYSDAAQAALMSSHHDDPLISPRDLSDTSQYATLSQLGRAEQLALSPTSTLGASSTMENVAASDVASSLNMSVSDSASQSDHDYQNELSPGPSFQATTTNVLGSTHGISGEGSNASNTSDEMSFVARKTLISPRSDDSGAMVRKTLLSPRSSAYDSDSSSVPKQTEKDQSIYSPRSTAKSSAFQSPRSLEDLESSAASVDQSVEIVGAASDPDRSLTLDRPHFEDTDSTTFEFDDTSAQLDLQSSADEDDDMLEDSVLMGTMRDNQHGGATQQQMLSSESLSARFETNEHADLTDDEDVLIGSMTPATRGTLITHHQDLKALQSATVTGAKKRVEEVLEDHFIGLPRSSQVDSVFVLTLVELRMNKRAHKSFDAGPRSQIRVTSAFLDDGPVVETPPQPGNKIIDAGTTVRLDFSVSYVIGSQVSLQAKLRDAFERLVRLSLVQSNAGASLTSSKVLATGWIDLDAISSVAPDSVELFEVKLQDSNDQLIGHLMINIQGLAVLRRTLLAVS